MSSEKRLLLLLLTLFLLNKSFGQSYSKGYIFGNKGDTAAGFIVLPSGNLPAARCFFKPTMNDNNVILSPGDIAGFHAANQTYYSTGLQLGGIDSVLFAKLFFRGTKELRYFEIGKWKYFVILGPDNSFSTIKYPPDLTPDEALSGMTADRKFKQQTDSIFPDSKDLPEYVNGVKPDINSVLNLFKQYHNQPSSAMTPGRLAAPGMDAYIKGFVITSDRDTLNGILGHSFNKTIFGSCIFSPGKDENTVRFLPDEIVGFGSKAKNMTYVSANIASGKRDTSAFVRLILDGAIDLLYYGNNGKHHFLFRDRQDHISELVYPQALSKNDYLSGLNSSKKFTLQADSIFSVLNIRGAETVRPKIKSMIKVLEDYHLGGKEPYRIYHGNQMKIIFGATAGIRMENYSYKIENDSYESYSSPSPFGGLYLGVINRSGNGLFMRNTLGYHHYNYSYSKDLDEYMLYRQISERSLANNFEAGLTVSALKRLRLKTFVEAGIVARYYFNKKFENYSEQVYPSGTVFSHADNDDVNPALFYGGTLKAGFRRPVRGNNSIMLSAGYSYLTGSVSDKINSVDLSVTYYF